MEIFDQNSQNTYFPNCCNFYSCLQHNWPGCSRALRVALTPPQQHTRTERARVLQQLLQASAKALQATSAPAKFARTQPTHWHQGSFLAMAANYKAAGRRLSSLQPKCRCSRQDTLFSAFVSFLVVLCTGICVWALSHARDVNVASRFVETLLSVVLTSMLGGKCPSFQNVVFATGLCWGGCMAPLAMASTTRLALPTPWSLSALNQVEILYPGWTWVLKFFTFALFFAVLLYAANRCMSCVVNEME
jgi:hypothetical protein